MKKSILLLLLLILVTSLLAQSRDTINNDTLRYVWPHYGYSAPYPKGYIDHIYGSADRYRIHGFFDTERFWVDTPTYIYGVALRACRRPQVGSLNYNLNNTYVRLYQQNSYILDQALLDTVSVQYNVITDNERNPIYISYYDTSNVWTDTLLQFYFKEPRLVHDTFVVFVTTLPYNPESTSKLGRRACLSCTWPQGYRSVYYTRIGADPDKSENWVIDGPLGEYAFDDGYRIFPIILPPEISRAERAAPRSPVLQRLDHEQCSALVLTMPPPDTIYRQQVVFASQPADPDTLTPIWVTPATRTVILRNLELGTNYRVWARNEIAIRYSYPQDTSYWSDWSEPLVFRLPPADTVYPRDTLWNTDTLWINDTTGVVGGELILLGQNGSIVIIDGERYIILGSDTIAFDDPRLIWVDNMIAVLGGTLVNRVSLGLATHSPSIHLFEVIPNPTTGEVTVEVADWNPDMTLELLDLQGRLLRSYQKSESSGQTNQHTGIWTLDLSSLPKGTYILRLTTPQGTTTQRLVKQ